ncbi:hypothetical protein BpHYR1_015523, partial [Brachionus plicatilis]
HPFQLEKHPFIKERISKPPLSIGRKRKGRGKEEERKRKGRGKEEERKRKGRGKEEERKRKGKESDEKLI